MSSPSAHGTDNSTGTRPYRSQKRQRPCDRCRERKLRCQTDGEPPCQRCQQHGVSCTFIGKPRKRTSLKAPHQQEFMCQGQSSPLAGHQQFHVSTVPHNQDYPSAVSSREDTAVAGSQEHLHNSGSGASLTHALGTPVLTGLHPHRPSTQLSQSLDQIEGHAAMLLGGSSESDPWLLRHCRFDGLGLRTFHKLHFRHAGGVPTSDRIPVHFLVSADELCESAAAETRVAEARELRAELDLLLPPAYGARLVRL